jgi:hypothetical protein
MYAVIEYSEPGPVSEVYSNEYKYEFIGDPFPPDKSNIKLKEVNDISLS